MPDVASERGGHRPLRRPPASAVTTMERFDLWHEVPLVPQCTGMSCWAAAAAMIVGWRECIDVRAEEVARGAGVWEAYRDGLLPDDVDSVARAFGLFIERPRSYTPAALHAMLDHYGPLWVGEASPGLHVVVVAGMAGDGTIDGTSVRIADPWPIGRGERYTISFREFAKNLEAAAHVVGATAQVLRGDGTRGNGRRSYQRFTTAYVTHPEHTTRSDTMATYVIDCGHGGSAPASRSTPYGVTGPSGLSEKEVTLHIGTRLARYLGPEALLTRSDDRNLSLADRAEIARRSGASVFISLHANEGPPGERGSETWVHSRAGGSSRALAASIQRELSRLGGPDRGTHAGDMAVLSPERHSPSGAACLVEVDFLSDPGGEARLRDPEQLDAIAQAIARGAACVHARALTRETLATGNINFNNPNPYSDGIESSGHPQQYINFHTTPGSGRVTLNFEGTYDTNHYERAVTFDVVLLRETGGGRWERHMTLAANSSGPFSFEWTRVSRDTDYFLALRTRDTACHVTGTYTVSISS